MYEEGRRLYTEINAAVRGARSAGADEIIVVDCHGARATGPSTRWCPSCWMRAARPSRHPAGLSRSYPRTRASNSWVINDPFVTDSQSQYSLHT
ncbi:MAG: hypothetical protein VCF24_03895 [Candidatus Latescibacterota bacterium]